jgi:hypothetical protein
MAVATGGTHSLALKSDGTLWAWGDNLFGQLGDGTTTDRSTPVPVSGLTGVVAVAAGNDYSLAVKSDGTLWAWGSTGFLPRGDVTPMQVPNLTGVVAVAATGPNNLAVKSDGTLWAWGWDLAGQLGDGTTPPSPSTPPLLVNLPGGVVAVGAGTSYSMAVKSDGTLWTWGDNSRGQLGDGTRTGRSTPWQLPGLPVGL